MGDEMRRTQHGNNNAYCQDTELSWLDWSLQERQPGLLRFVKTLAAFRQRRDVVDEDNRYTLNQLLARAPIEWHGVALGRPDWGDDSHALAFTLRSLRGRFVFHGMLNAYWEPLTFELPAVPDGAERWRICLDTARASPDDVHHWAEAPAAEDGAYPVQPRSVVLLARRTP
jgi:glycogen operon protein